ncbi:MAG: hypothetical protein NTW87_22740 [Planctomycetota bacterium]|nr:hypothetical protein [Planctomycetota bacterium]
MSDDSTLSPSTGEDDRATMPPAPGFKPRLFFMRPRLQWGAVLCSLAAPAAYVSYTANLSGPAVVLTIIIGGSLLLLYVAADAFDPGAIPSPSRPSRAVGYILKLLALGHAVGAIKFAYHMFSGDEPRAVDLSFLATLSVLMWLWLIAALAYLCGDAHIHSVKHSMER